MSKTAIIFGSHPIRQTLQAQYGAAGVHVTLSDGFTADGLPASVPDEAVVLTSGLHDDLEACAFLQLLADTWRGRTEKRPLVHLLLQKASTLRMLLVSDFPAAVNEVLDVYPFTMEGTWAERILLRLPGLGGHPKAGLDRLPIGKDCRQFVHLVVVGFDSYAQSVAITAARIAHYPNYAGKSSRPLRTRITIIGSGVLTAKDPFIARHQTLFENSFYRTVDVPGRKSQLHHPLYEGKREDFVDVEWEFVEGEPDNPVIRDKISLWTEDAGRQTTIVISGPDDASNVDKAISLPGAVSERDIPVWVRMHRDMISATLLQSPKYKNLIPFGMDTEGYDTGTPLLRMARLLHYFYRCCYGEVGVPSTFPRDEVEKEWRTAGPLKMRLSNVYNVMMMAGKMHSLGHDPEDLSTYYAMTRDEIESLSRTEHNRWSVERLLSGVRPCTDEERKTIRENIRLKREFKARDIHYDLCAYDELGVDETGKDVRSYDTDLTASIPLIVESYLKEAGR